MSRYFHRRSRRYAGHAKRTMRRPPFDGILLVLLVIAAIMVGCFG